jgi:predicted PurR-regulated permease PerM
MFLNIENAFLIGFLAGIINVIPYIGPIIGATFGVIIGITTNLDLDFYSQIIPLSFKIISVFAIMQIIDNFIFQPLIFSNSVKAHPLEIFIVVLSAGTLWGITAMLVAIPFYTILRVMAKEFLSDFKFVQKLTKNI